MLDKFRERRNEESPRASTCHSNRESQHMASWPSGEWQELTVPLSFTGLQLPAVNVLSLVTVNQRLGLAIGLKSNSSELLEVNYDSIDLESRLEIEMTTPIG